MGLPAPERVGIKLAQLDLAAGMDVEIVAAIDTKTSHCSCKS
jgi:hypothetical protein